MSSGIPESWSDAGPMLSEDAVTGNARATRMNQPWRAWVAAAEVLLAALLIVAALWAWGRGSVPMELPASDGTVDVLTRVVGSWLTLAVLFGTVAGLFVVDAFRQLVLAVGTGRRRKARQVGRDRTG